VLANWGAGDIAEIPRERRGKNALEPSTTIRQAVLHRQNGLRYSSSFESPNK